MKFIVEPDKPDGAFILAADDDGYYSCIAHVFNVENARVLAAYANEGLKYISA